MAFFTRLDKFVVLLPLALTLVACSSEDIDPTPVDACVTRGESYQALTDDVRTSLGVKGAQFAVMTSECGVWIGASGQANDTETLTETHVLAVGSITKTFVAGTVLHLVSEGKLSLDDTLDKYQPNFPRANEYTIRHLLDHTSKIVSYTATPGFLDAFMKDPGRVWSTQEFLDWAASEMMTNPAYAMSTPGVEFEYSNTNYVLLGLIIEQVTGKDIATAIREQALTPLELTQTSFAGEEPVVGNRADGYDAVGTDITTAYDPSIAWASGAIVSNAKDLVMWGSALYGGDYLPQTLHDDMLKPTTASEMDADPNSAYGLGAYIYDGDAWKAREWGHPGDYLGYHAVVAYLPDQKATFAMIVNQDPKDEHSLLGTKVNDMIGVVIAP